LTEVQTGANFRQGFIRDFASQPRNSDSIKKDQRFDCKVGKTLADRRPIDFPALAFH
jgi:hypothetical protein